MVNMFILFLLLFSIPMVADSSVIGPRVWGTVSVENHWMEVNSQLFVGNSRTSNEEFQGLIEFDLLNSNSNVVNNFLNITFFGAANELNFSIFGYVADLEISRDDLNSGIELVGNSSISDSRMLTFDVTTFINNYGISRYLGFNIQPKVSGGFPKDTIWEISEVGLGDFGEVIKLNDILVVPLPNTFGLFLIGLIGLKRYLRLIK